MDLPSIDLNLLVALNALLRERNVTRAGESIGLSQPAMSASLGRLRRHFGDELLTRNGQRYVLTPLAAALVEQTDVALRYVGRTFAARPVFDAETSDREFTILMSDYALTVLGEPLLRLLEERAPDVQLRIRPNDRLAVDEAHATLRAYDFMVLPRGYLADLRSADLFRDRWVCVVGDQNSVVGDELTVEHLGRLRWIMTYDAPTQYTPVDKHLRLVGIDRHADVVIESFLALPFLLASTQRAGVLQERAARKLAASGGLRILELPSSPPDLVEALWWHPSREGDPGHRWLQQLFVEAAETLSVLPFDRAVAPDAGDSPGASQEI
jgi:DNA-binding transcriptional LysR family regulator